MSSLGGGDKEYTYRGKPLSGDLGTQSIQGRGRSNSIRRLDQRTLEGLKGHKSKEVSMAATRELGVRGDMEELSKGQLKDSSHPRMKAIEPSTKREVDALRFASSMAQEAQEELNSDPSYARPSKKTFGSIGMLGVATVKGRMGFGISGSDEKNLENEKDIFQASHRVAVQKRMLVLQKHYEERGQTDDWSTQLVGTSAPTVFAGKGENVCAASRATAAALGGGGGKVMREELPTPDSLIEVSSTAVNHRSTHMTDFMALPKEAYKGLEPKTPMLARGRSASSGNVMDSCKKCLSERVAKVEK